jgi:CRISPR/Cas system-associated exonuclease Cas4 (RecB family)
MRFYDLGINKKYPSITTILSHTSPKEKIQSLENWKKSIGEKEAAKIARDAADRGTTLHLLAERFLKNEPLIKDNENISQSHIGIFNGLKLFLNNVNEIWGQEVTLYSDILEIAGRCDLICKYKGIPSIVDFKTTTRLKTKNEIEDYFLQAGFYAFAHNEMFNTKINNLIILMVNNNGFPLEFNEKLDNVIEKLIDRINEFYSLYINI